MKKLSILGSTGSVGANALEVVENFPDQVAVIALAARKNGKRLFEQAQKFRPKFVALYDEKEAELLRKRLSFCPVVSGKEGLLEAATHKDCDQVLFAMSGSKAIAPCLAAILEGKTILLANKEILVSAGSIIMKAVKKKQALLLPVDSEHSAIHQCLHSGSANEVFRVILTASGGPFLRYTDAQLARVKARDALKHPNWKMGDKISVDSSTLMNKGLEVIEAYHLFGLEKEQISVVVHPESVVHSMVEYQDGNIIAQLSEPDMQLPLQYALFYPKRLARKRTTWDFLQKQSLTFLPPDTEKFPCLEFAWRALGEKSSFACTLNAANEELVRRFLQEEISWREISLRLEKILSLHRPENMLSLDHVDFVDKEARILANQR